MKIIKVVVDTKGKTTVETKGFSGGECRHASRFVEEALGIVASDRPTAEAFQVQSQPGKIDLRG